LSKLPSIWFFWRHASSAQGQWRVRDRLRLLTDCHPRSTKALRTRRFLPPQWRPCRNGIHSGLKLTLRFARVVNGTSLMPKPAGVAIEHWPRQKTKPSLLTPVNAATFARTGCTQASALPSAQPARLKGTTLTCTSMSGPKVNVLSVVANWSPLSCSVRQHFTTNPLTQWWRSQRSSREESAC